MSAEDLALSKGKTKNHREFSASRPKQLNHSHIQPPSILPTTVGAGSALWEARIQDLPWEMNAVPKGAALKGSRVIPSPTGGLGFTSSSGEGNTLIGENLSSLPRTLLTRTWRTGWRDAGAAAPPPARLPQTDAGVGAGVSDASRPHGSPEGRGSFVAKRTNRCGRGGEGQAHPRCREPAKPWDTPPPVRGPRGASGVPGALGEPWRAGGG